MPKVLPTDGNSTTEGEEMIITASDRIAAVAAVVAMTETAAKTPTEAQEVEGRWMLKGQTEETGGAALVIDRYGLRVIPAAEDEDGNIREDPYAHAAYLTGPAVVDLRKHLNDLWQCPECDHWMRGAGVCAMLCDWDNNADTTTPDPAPEAEKEQARWVFTS